MSIGERHQLQFPVRILLLIGYCAVFLSACKSDGSRGASSPPVQDAQDKSLRKEVQKLMNSQEGIFAMAYRNLDSGEEVFINVDDRFHAASTMKTPVLIELYKRAAEGDFDLDDSITVTNQFYSIVDSSLYSMSIDEDSEGELYQLIDQQATIRDLAEAMITQSSNLATNVLIDLVDARRVTQTMRTLGADSIMVLRGVEDIKAYEAGLSNSTTARDLLTIFTKLALGEVVSDSADAQMLETHKRQQWNDVIPVHLPSDVTIAHKTGSITGVHHDAAILYPPGLSPYVLVVMSREMSDFDAGTAMLARVSEAVYNHHSQSH